MPEEALKELYDSLNAGSWAGLYQAEVEGAVAEREFAYISSYAVLYYKNFKGVPDAPYLTTVQEADAYLDSIAWIAFKQKRFAEAEKHIAEALKHGNPRDGISVILEHAGDIAAALKKDPRRFYDLALKYAPFDAEFEPEVVQKKLKQLK